MKTYVIELHDNEVDNLTDGTLVCIIGRKGTIQYAYQVEMHLQEVLNAGWRRAYLRAGEEIKVVWTRDMETGKVQYLARTSDYTGEWNLPFAGPKDAQIAVGIWGRDATTDEEAQIWAASQLANAATAILLDRSKIRFAWEVISGSPQLVARGPAGLR